ncbi:hypothetical protein XFF1815_500027 [Xanthomonas citri pv. fuscans]|nr:hypothetical protein XFF7766_340061 [Xanthomonas citri pv. fuscans]SOO44330.1 hypothetical protein XFF1815_500027 [Xanthomonas citri pv. fuscans]
MDVLQPALVLENVGVAATPVDQPRRAAGSRCADALRDRLAAFV